MPMRGFARRQWKPEEDFYQHVEEGYDKLAQTYDEEIGSNLVGIRMREVFRKALLEALLPGQLAFEIGCGTGTDAIWLARRGLEVVATDISEAMLTQVLQKAKAEGLAERIRCRRLKAREIGRLQEEFGSEAFDWGYCHAGALNMEPELPWVPSQIRSLLKRGAPFVCSVINKTSLFELLFYPMVLRPRKAFRRLGNIVPIPISRMKPLREHVIPSRFYSPREMIHLFRDGFSMEAVQGLRILLPPSNLTDMYATLRPVFAPLERLEDRLSKVWPLNSWGHHTILTFRRR